MAMAMAMGFRLFAVILVCYLVLVHVVKYTDAFEASISEANESILFKVDACPFYLFSSLKGYTDTTGELIYLKEGRTETWNERVLRWDTRIADILFYGIHVWAPIRIFFEANLTVPIFFIGSLIYKSYLSFNSEINAKKKASKTSKEDGPSLSSATTSSIHESFIIRCLYRFAIAWIFAFIGILTQHFFLQVGLLYRPSVVRIGGSELLSLYTRLQGYIFPCGQFVSFLMGLGVAYSVFSLRQGTILWPNGVWMTFVYSCLFFIIRRKFRNIYLDYNHATAWFVYLIVSCIYSFIGAIYTDQEWPKNISDISQFVNLMLYFIWSEHKILSTLVICIPSLLYIYYFSITWQGTILYWWTLLYKDFRWTAAYVMAKWTDKIDYSTGSLFSKDSYLPLPAFTAAKNSTYLLWIMGGDVAMLNHNNIMRYNDSVYIGPTNSNQVFTLAIQQNVSESMDGCCSNENFSTIDLTIADTLHYWIRSIYILRKIFESGVVIPLFYILFMIYFMICNYRRRVVIERQIQDDDLSISDEDANPYEGFRTKYRGIYQHHFPQLFNLKTHLDYYDERYAFVLSKLLWLISIPVKICSAIYSNVLRPLLEKDMRLVVPFLILAFSVIVQHLMVQSLIYYHPFGAEDTIQAIQLVMNRIVTVHAMLSTLFAYFIANEVYKCRPKIGLEALRLEFLVVLLWSLFYYCILRLSKNFGMWICETFGLIVLFGLLVVSSFWNLTTASTNITQWFKKMSSFVKRKAFNNIISFDRFIFRRKNVLIPLLIGVFSILLMFFRNGTSYLLWTLIAKPVKSIYMYLKYEISFDATFIMYTCSDFLFSEAYKESQMLPYVINIDHAIGVLLLYLGHWCVYLEKL